MIYLNTYLYNIYIYNEYKHYVVFEVEYIGYNKWIQKNVS
jgi:hypothetical protein